MNKYFGKRENVDNQQSFQFSKAYENVRTVPTAEADHHNLEVVAGKTVASAE